MSFDDQEPREPYDGVPFSKGHFLKMCVQCGVGLTGYGDFDGRSVEMPYPGAHLHAQELEAEGMITSEVFEGTPNCTWWLPTVAGKIVGAS